MLKVEECWWLYRWIRGNCLKYTALLDKIWDYLLKE